MNWIGSLPKVTKEAIRTAGYDPSDLTEWEMNEIEEGTIETMQDYGWGFMEALKENCYGLSVPELSEPEPAPEQPYYILMTEICGVKDNDPVEDEFATGYDLKAAEKQARTLSIEHDILIGIYQAEKVSLDGVDCWFHITDEQGHLIAAAFYYRGLRLTVS